MCKFERNINIFIDFLNGASVQKLNVIYGVTTCNDIICKLARKIYQHHHKGSLNLYPQPSATVIRKESGFYRPYAIALLKKAKEYDINSTANKKEIDNLKGRISKLECKLKKVRADLLILESEK